MYGFSQPKSGAPDKYQESSLNEKIITGQWITKEIRATMSVVLESTKRPYNTGQRIRLAVICRLNALTSAAVLFFKLSAMCWNVSDFAPIC